MVFFKNYGFLFISGFILKYECGFFSYSKLLVYIFQNLDSESELGFFIVEKFYQNSFSLDDGI